jgi:hypothetical protein
MPQEQFRNSRLDQLMREALNSGNDLRIPEGLAEKTIQRLEKRTLLRELILELLVKAGIIISCLFVLVVVFVWINGQGVLGGFYEKFLNNRHLIASILILASITILIDQVLLRFLNTLKKDPDWKYE